LIQANATGQLADGDPLIGRVRDIDDMRRILRSHTGMAIHVDSTFDAERPTTAFRSLAWHLFDAEHAAFFRQLLVLTMLRDPFRSFLSSYGFVTEAKDADPGFLPDLEVGGVGDYLDQVHENAILHFLLEPELAHRRTMTRADLERVKAGIVDLPIHVGIYERYAESIEYFGRVMNRPFEVGRVPALNVGAPPSEVDPGLEARFRERNRLDVELYDFAATRLTERLKALRRQR
jgi:hypothetical protein